MILSGIISTIITFFLLKTTDLGVYAVVGVSVVVSILKNMIYTIPYAASYLGFRKTQFYPQVIMCFLSTVGTSTFGYLIRRLFVVTNWFEFLLCAVVMGVVCYALNIAVFLNREEKRLLWDKIKNKFGRGM
jgi:uncharacterized membrane protein